MAETMEKGTAKNKNEKCHEVVGDVQDHTL